ncbi:MAG: hypothetical protein ACTHM6_04225 [Tepidisphaeraceae bacterium]
MNVTRIIRGCHCAAFAAALGGALASLAVAQVPTTTVTVPAKHKRSEKQWTDRPTRILDTAALPAQPNIPLDAFGGRADRKLGPPGFFRVTARDGRWTFIDPAGNEFFSIGQCAVDTNDTEGGQSALKQKFGDRAGWARATAALLKQNGFNTLGCWSDFKAFNAADARLPYTTQLNLMTEYGHSRKGTYQQPGHTGFLGDCIFVFDPQFEPFARKRAADLLAATRDDPYLLGHFSDNELPLNRLMLDRYLKLPDKEPGRIAADKWWSARQGATSRAITDEDREAFAQFVADRYYRIASEAIKAADPNHLYLGSRWVNSSSRLDGILLGAAPYIDVLSINYYGAWTPDPAWLDKWSKLTKKPFMITEWYAKGDDSGMANSSGAGWLVKTQADRGKFYQNFALDLLAYPNCVGWHWFKYIDNDPANLKTDPSNRDSNKGIVTNRYDPYQPLLDAMRELNVRAYALRDHPPAFITPPATEPAQGRN